MIRASRRLSRLGVFGLLGCTTILVAMMAFVILDVFPNSTERAQESPVQTDTRASGHTGVITIRTGSGGQCRHLQFDNSTGAFWEGGSGECRPQVGSGTNSTEGRMNSIRDAFTKK